MLPPSRAPILPCPTAACLALMAALTGAAPLMAAPPTAAAGVAPAATALPTSPDASKDIVVPSGHSLWWLDTVDNVPGPSGLTFRYRFVMPDLAKLVPSTTGPVSDDLTEEDMAELDRLGTTPPSAPGQMMDMAPPDGSTNTVAEAEMVSPEDLNLPDFRPEDFTEGAEAEADQPGPLPADPDLLLQDPVHGDIVWLCEKWVLPRLADDKPLPEQVVISLADRPTKFGAADPNTVQLFEAFAIAPDRKSCIWQGF